MKREPYTKASERRDETPAVTKARLIANRARQEALAQRFREEEGVLIVQKAALILKPAQKYFSENGETREEYIRTLERAILRRQRKHAHTSEKADLIDKQIWESGIKEAVAS